jgi:hypothetical protein
MAAISKKIINLPIADVDSQNSQYKMASLAHSSKYMELYSDQN